MSVSRLKTSTITNGLSKTQSLWNKETYDGIVKNGLIVHLDAANSSSYSGSGNIWYDLSGNSNNFTIQNSVPYTSTSPSYFEFTRTSSHYMVNTTLGNYNWSNGFTVGVWHRNPTSPDLTYYRGLITNGISGDRTGSWEMRYGRENFYGGTQNGTSLGCAVTTASSSNQTDIYSPNGVWGYYVLVYNNRYMTLYKNGYSFSARDVAGGVAKTVATGGITIGSSPGSSEYIDGRISHVHLYNRPLSKDEVLANFNALKSRHGL